MAAVIFALLTALCWTAAFFKLRSNIFTSVMFAVGGTLFGIAYLLSL